MGKARKERMVAIIEDRSYRVTMQRLLKSAVSMFLPTEDFLNARQQQETGCLIADSRMPGLNLQSKLNSDHFPTQTIFITARGDEKMPLRAVRTGEVEIPYEALLTAKLWLSRFSVTVEG